MQPLTKETIQEFIVKNYKKLNTREMADKLKTSSVKIVANVIALRKKGLLELSEKPTKYEEKIRNRENTYTNHDGQNKEVARIKMANYIIDSGVVGTIPTLPNTSWAIEQKIDKQISGNEFIGVECDEATFNVMKAKLKHLKLKAKTIFGFIGSIIYGKLENTYAHLILDYCGNLATISKEVEYAIYNDIVNVGGIIAVTFSKPIRGTDIQSEKLKSLSAINNTDERCMSDKGVEAYFNKITGWNYQVVEFFYYQDTYPMTLVIIKRIK